MQNTKLSVSGIVRVTVKPELKRFDSGAAVCTLNVASKDRRPTKDDQGNWSGGKDCFITCKAWDRGNYKLAVICSERLAVGDEVHITGHLALETWKAKDGSNRSKNVILLDEVTFLTKPRAKEPTVDEDETAPEPVAEDNPF